MRIYIRTHIFLSFLIQRHGNGVNSNQSWPQSSNGHEPPLITAVEFLDVIRILIPNIIIIIIIIIIIVLVVIVIVALLLHNQGRIS
jgi:hypothetical protein